jgi:hypothetical protein
MVLSAAYNAYRQLGNVSAGLSGMPDPMSVDPLARQNAHQNYARLQSEEAPRLADVEANIDQDSERASPRWPALDAAALASVALARRGYSYLADIYAPNSARSLWTQHTQIQGQVDSVEARVKVAMDVVCDNDGALDYNQKTLCLTIRSLGS